MSAVPDVLAVHRRSAQRHPDTLAKTRRCVESSRVRAAHYQARALEAAALATDSLLTQVREKHETAADAWARLADLERRITAGATARMAREPVSAAHPAAA